MKLYDMIVANKVLGGGGGVTPTGTINITQNGDADVTNYATAHVAVPQPTGTISITQNGTVDVAQYATADVNVSGGGGDEALAGLIDRSITSIDIPNGVTSIGSYAFESCSRLEQVTVPHGVTRLWQYAFSGTKIVSIDLPSTVTRIDNGAFSSNTNFTTLTCRAEMPPTLGTGVFSSTNITSIYVPAASVDAYKAASRWSSYADKIQAIPSA